MQNLTHYIFSLAFILSFSQARVAHAQSQAEVESEMSVGESDAAMAEEKQVEARLHEDVIQEEEAKKAAKINAEKNEKRTAEIRAHINQMKAAIIQANRGRLQATAQTANEKKLIAKLEKEEALVEMKIKTAQTELELTNKRQKQSNALLSKTQEQIQKVKSELEAIKTKEVQAKADNSKKDNELVQAKANLNDKRIWKTQEIKRIALLNKKLAKDQAAIEVKIKETNLQIKKLEAEVSGAQKSNSVAQENLQRADNLKNENLNEVAKLQKQKRGQASVKNH